MVGWPENLGDFFSEGGVEDGNVCCAAASRCQLLCIPLAPKRKRYLDEIEIGKIEPR